MKNERLYQDLKEKRLVTILPRPLVEILSPESPKTLFDLAHESSARREFLQSGVSEPDGTLDQFGQQTGFLNLPDASSELLNQAYEELENIEHTWIQFHKDAMAAGDVDSAKFVQEVILQYFGFDPEL